MLGQADVGPEKPGELDLKDSFVVTSKERVIFAHQVMLLENKK